MYALMGTISGLIKTYIKGHKPPGLLLRAIFNPNIPAVFVLLNEGSDRQWYMISAESVTEEDVRRLMA